MICRLSLLLPLLKHHSESVQKKSVKTSFPSHPHAHYNMTDKVDLKTEEYAPFLPAIEVCFCLETRVDTLNC